MNDAVMIIVMQYCDDFKVQRFIMANKLCFLLFTFKLVKMRASMTDGKGSTTEKDQNLWFNAFISVSALIEKKRGCAYIKGAPQTFGGENLPPLDTTNIKLYLRGQPCNEFHTKELKLLGYCLLPM